MAVIKTNPKKQGANKRTEFQREEDLVLIARLYLAGETQREIAAQIGTARPYTLSQPQICADIQTVIDRWKALAIHSIDEKKANELARINHVEREAWLAWERSRLEYMRTVQEQRTGDKKRVKHSKASVTKEQQVGDPRFLEIILKCVKSRRELFGLDAPQKVELGGEDGGPILHQYDAALEKVYGDPRFAIPIKPAGPFSGGNGHAE